MLDGTICRVQDVSAHVVFHCKEPFLTAVDTRFKIVSHKTSNQQCSISVTKKREHSKRHQEQRLNAMATAGLEHSMEGM